MGKTSEIQFHEFFANSSDRNLPRFYFFSTPLTVEELVVEEEVAEVVQVFLKLIQLYFWELWPLLWLF